MPTIQSFPLGAYVVAANFLGKTPVFALGDGMVALADGVSAEKFQAHSGGLLAAARTWDGDRLITSGDDGRVVAIDPAGKIDTIAEKPKKWIDQLATGPDGVIAFAGGREAYVHFPNGKERTLEHERTVAGLAFAPKGLRLAVARYNGVSLWWIGTDAKPQSLEWKGSHIGVTFSPDGRHVVTAMQENALHGWRVADGGGHMRMSGYPGKVKSISWSVKGRFLATSGAEMAVLWPFHFKDGPMGKQPLQLGARDKTVVTVVACHPTEEVVAIGYKDGMVLAARFGDGDEVVLRKAGESPVTALAWDKTGIRLAFGTEDGEAGIVDLRG
ncbi:WD40 repeat domain-containing protein [Kaistia dalseonensis]|uniref:WD40 repeat protein n=1 Tax=Kaistia dalseonensis TaxID=410840 RepID=A0ABU0HDA3_9HYPH|nr:WD40 repeat domain-containing protein [Kaistia dalseonensis]MCX5496843.1 WD40 repeat domain-containing protein [Kaistia dalseonensis]MDQ0439469.1 WD40 repeat protein [Kaistia dalseonensis]